MKNSLNIYGSFDAHSSYGLHTLAALERINFSGKFAYRVSDDIVSRPAVMQSVSDGRPKGATLQISPPDVKIGPDTIIWTMTESAGLFPRTVDNLNKAIAVVVPNNWCAEIFSAAGVVVPIHVVNLGIDMRTFVSVGPPEKDPTDPIIFGWLGSVHGAGARKNLQTAINAFAALDCSRPAVLRVKLLPSYPPSAIRWPRLDTKKKTIQIDQTFFSIGKLLKWFQGLDLFLSTSSGEAVNLPAIQAISCGVPLISPVHAGVASYSTPTNTINIDFDLRRRPDLAEYYPGLMADIYQHEVMNAMRRGLAFLESHGVIESFRLSRTVDHLTWENSMANLVRVLKQYFDLDVEEPSSHYQPD